MLIMLIESEKDKKTASALKLEEEKVDKVEVVLCSGKGSTMLFPFGKGSF